MLSKEEVMSLFPSATEEEARVVAEVGNMSVLELCRYVAAFDSMRKALDDARYLVDGWTWTVDGARKMADAARPGPKRG